MEGSDPALNALFKYFSRFNALSAKAEQAIAEICSVAEIKRHKDLQPIGHTCKTIYFINKGAARIYYFTNDVEVTECFAFENNIIARIESLFTGKPSRKAIQILEDAEVVAIDANRLFKLYDSYPDIERLFRKIFETAYVESVNRIEGMQFHSADERYDMLVKDVPRVLMRVPLKYIASYLGITQVSLSRIRGQK